MGWREQLAAATAEIEALEAKLLACGAENITLKARIAELEAPAPEPTPEPIPEPEPTPAPVATSLGLHTGHNSSLVTEVAQTATWIGKPIKTVVLFVGNVDTWAAVEVSSWLRDLAKSVLASGRQASLQLAMMPKNMGLTLAQAASGAFDAHWRTLANNLAASGLLGIELRVAHEMDGNWYPWGVKGKPELNATFAAAFRRMVTVMRAAQPTNKWTIVWNPTADNWPLTNSLAYLESLWPGDAYVDQIGADFYDKSFDTGKVYYPIGSDRLTRQKEVWAKLAVRLATMSALAKSHGKPLQFPEWALMYYNPTGQHAGWGGGDNPYFIEQMHKFVADPANNVAMHSYFDVKSGAGDEHRISPPAGTVFAQASTKFKSLFGA